MSKRSPLRRLCRPSSRRRAEAPAKSDEEIAAEQAELVEVRANLLVKTRELLPQGFESRGKSGRDIMLAAIGDALADADKRDDGYLEATLDSIVEQRSAAGRYRSGLGTSTTQVVGKEEFDKILQARSMPAENVRQRAVREQIALQEKVYKEAGGR